MTPQHKKKEPTCTIKCPAIRGDDKGTWYCRIMKAYVAPSEYHFEYGFDVVREGNITHSGYSTPCNAMELFHSRPAPSPTSYDHDVIGEFCKTARAEAAAQARETVLDELCENIKEDFKEDFDGELMINYQDFLWTVQSLRRTGGDPL